jgi:hypothetical protein
MKAGGGDKKSGKAQMPDPIPNTGQARDEAAEMFGVAPRYVSDAKKIKEEAPELFEAVRSGVGSCPASSHGVRERFHSTLAGCPIPILPIQKKPLFAGLTSATNWKF